MKTRRDFLMWMAAAPAAAQVAGLDRRGPVQHVAVLGAGLAGLCAAYELQNQGHRVTVLEAQLRPGGRVRTLREGFAPGLYGEAGAEAIPAGHDITQHYARTFGLRLLPERVPGTRSFYHIRGQRYFPGAADTVWPFELTEEERRLGMAGLRQKYLDPELQRALDAGFPRQIGRVMSRWDGHTPGAWFRSQGASKGAAELLSFGFGTDFGSAASYLLHGLNSRGSGPAWRIEGGNDQLPQAFAAKLEIRYGAAVAAVKQDERSVQITLQAAGATETITADRAICTLPCPAIGKIFQDARLSDAKQRAIREQNYSRTVKVFLQSRRRFWLKDRFSGNVTADLPIERLTADPGTEVGERGALTAYPIGPYTAALERMTEDERVAAAFGQARQIFSELGASFEGGVAHCWGLDRWQRGSFALHTPGQIGFLDTLGRNEGRIHFAGEHTSAWTGWMQGALDSARRVVQEING